MTDRPNEKEMQVGHESRERQAAEYPDELDFSSTPAGEAREAGEGETESLPVVREPGFGAFGGARPSAHRR